MSRDPFWLSRDEVRELDRRAVAEFGIPSIVLMENAGRGAAEIMAREYPDRPPVAILCGPGNNGGDGFVVARHLHRDGWMVTLWDYASPGESRLGDAAVQEAIARRCGIACYPAAAFEPTPRELIIDALYGTGLNRPLTGEAAALIARVNAGGSPVVSLDLPSGLDCDSGEALGPTIEARHTVTFAAWKRGFLNPASRRWTGTVHVARIGEPLALVNDYRNR